MSRLTGVITASGDERDCPLDGACQGATLDELRENLEEVLQLLKEARALKSFSEFVGLQNISLRVA